MGGAAAEAIDYTGAWVLTSIVSDGALVIDGGGIEMILTPGTVNATGTADEEELTQPLSNLTLADFAGYWEMDHLEGTIGWYDVEELGLTMTVVITGADAAIIMTTEEGTQHYTAVLETEENADVGTILWAHLPDYPTMMFLLFDDGQLVCYEYDMTYESHYYYCFNKVVTE